MSLSRGICSTGMLATSLGLAQLARLAIEKAFRKKKTVSEVHSELKSVLPLLRIEVLAVTIQEYVSPIDELDWEGSPIGMMRNPILRIDPGNTRLSTIWDEMGWIAQHRMRRGGVYIYRRHVDGDKVKFLERESCRIQRILYREKYVAVYFQMTSDMDLDRLSSVNSVMSQHQQCNQCQIPATS